MLKGPKEANKKPNKWLHQTKDKESEQRNFLKSGKKNHHALPKATLPGLKIPNLITYIVARNYLFLSFIFLSF